MNFNIYSIPPLISSIIFIILGLFVFLKNRKSAVNFIFFLMCCTTFGWQFTWFILFTFPTDKFIPLLIKIGYSWIIFIPITFYHFAMRFIEAKRVNKIIIFSYVLGLVFLVINWTSAIFISGYYKYFWGFYPKAGYLHPLYLLMLLYLNLDVLIRMRSKIRYEQISALRKNQIRYSIFGICLYLLASTDFIINYGIEFYPMGFIFIILCCFALAYAILRYQLMDIEVIIKKTLVFAGLFTFAFGVIVGVAMITQELLSHFLAISRFVSLAISAAIIIFSLRPLENFLVNITNKYLFQKKYEYKQILKAFIKEVITVLNLDEVVNSTLKLFDKTIHPYAASVFILNKVEDKYQLYNSYGIEDKNLSFTSDSKLIILLKNTKVPAVIRQIDGITGVNPEIAAEMARFKAVIVLPLALHDDLIGFISLGKKKSDDEYTKDDMDVFLDLAGTESIAVGNAQLLQEAAQTERRAAIGTMAAGINHEIGNPVNIINTKIQLFLASVERGFYEQKSKEDIIRECRDILVETIKQTNRIADITRRLSNFAKPSKEFKPELISVANEIDEALFVVGHELELGRIKIKKEMAVDLYKILADRREMQQIFFNLIRNAAQAIEGTGTITVRALSTTDGKMRVEIEDTGKGIPEDKIHRIFEPFFTTKGPNKGTGLGLSIVRQLVWRNKGEISFKSQAGAGTTFILEFPRATG